MGATYPTVRLTPTQWLVLARLAAGENFSATGPLDAEIAPGDALLIGGRRFAVVGVGRGGAYAVTATVALREDT